MTAAPSATSIRQQQPPPEAVTGVQLARGIGVAPAKGFWADAWSRVLKRPGAVAALIWLAIVAFFAVYAPMIASGHPIRVVDVATGNVTWPLWTYLRPSDLALAVGVPLAIGWVYLGGKTGRADRLAGAVVGLFLGAVVVAVCSILVDASLKRDLGLMGRFVKGLSSPAVTAPAIVAAAVFVLGMLLPALPVRRRAAIGAAACILAGLACSVKWERPLGVFNYTQREAAGEITATYTLVPFSPSQRFTELDRRPPWTDLADALAAPEGSPLRGRRFVLGTDAFGQDVLANLLHACRLSISIGLVSTGIAVLIGVTLGSLMGYFGGWVDLLLFRVVEIFMAVPLLFLLIVAAAVLPPEMRSTYVMMAIIGGVTWTGAARFTRAEFLRLRNQDFVQSAAAMGLPLRSILFRHMLPNGVTPVLVDASFAIAAAISIEATLSFLGLGPVDQASWGKLLSSATSSEGQFKWWLAIFPGAAIFFTVLAYNMLGEALRDAIDPKLKKARV